MMGVWVWRIAGLHEALIQALDDGLSAAAAATRLNKTFGTTLSRNSIIGRAHRKGISLSGVPGRRTKEDELALRRKARAEAMRVRRAMLRLKTDVEIVMPNVTAEPAPIGPVHDVAAPGACHWPHGDTAGTQWLMCGHEAVRGSPYCPHHHARAFDRFSTAASARKFRAAHLAEVA